MFTLPSRDYLMQQRFGSSAVASKRTTTGEEAASCSTEAQTQFISQRSLSGVATGEIPAKWRIRWGGGRGVQSSHFKIQKNLLETLSLQQ